MAWDMQVEEPHYTHPAERRSASVQDSGMFESAALHARITMIWFLTALTLVSPISLSFQERPRIPKDSVEIVVIGCLTGRALKTSDVKFVDTQSGPTVGSRTFRLAAKRDLMKEIKRENGHLVEVSGVVKRSALDEQGVKVGSRVEIGGGSPVSRSGIPSPADSIPVMDVTSIRTRASSCAR